MLKIKIIKIKKNYILIKINKIEKNITLPIINIIRQITISCIKGNKIQYIKIRKIKHEYDYINGISEDILEICQKIKEINFKTKYKRIFINIKKIGPSFIKNKDFEIKNVCKVINKKRKIVKINKNINLEIGINIINGIGYINNKENSNFYNMKNKEKRIFINNTFSPIKNIKYKIIKKCFENDILIKIKTNRTLKTITIPFELTNIIKKQIYKLEYKTYNQFLYEKVNFININKKNLIYLKKNNIVFIKNLIYKKNNKINDIIKFPYRFFIYKKLKEEIKCKL
ncbi:MAG: hypothetical protein AAYR31_00660 [Candidatus Vidania fulgoroideorum]